MHRIKPDFPDLDDIPNVFPSTNDSGDESIIDDIQYPPDSQSNLKGNDRKVNYPQQVREAIPINKRLKNFSANLPPIEKNKDSLMSDDRLNINLSQNKLSFLELHHILEETNRKKHKSKVSLSKKIVDDDYDELQEDNSFEEESDVRELEKWHLEMKKRNSNLRNYYNPSVVQLNERNDIFKSPHKKGQSSISSHEPHLNTDLMNRILLDSDEEKELKKFTKDKVINYQINDDNDDNPQQSGPTNKFKGLENAMKETNMEILDEMIIKKIKIFASTVDMEKQTEEQWKYQVKKITEEIVRHFNSLKSVESVTLLHTHVEGIIKKIRKKKVEIAKTFAFKDTKAEETSKLIDYKTMEIVHVKSYEQIVDEMTTLRNQLSNASSHLSAIKAEIHSKNRQLDGIRKKLSILDEETFKKAEEKPGRTNIEKKLATPNSSVEEYIKIQKVKYELKKQETEFVEQIEAQEKFAAQFSSEAEKIEAKLRTAKDLKAHTRMKLKELYLKILKDEVELQNSTNCTSYSWVLRALWKLGDDISDPSIFPNFLDRDNIDFLVSYAKAQAELEDHCRRYNLQGFTSGMDDFKHLEIMDAKNYMNTETTKESVLPPINKFHEKDRDSLMSDVKNRMLDMKRANLKAKRLIHLAQYGPKGKQIVEKWEEVNPAESANLPLVDVNGQYYMPQKVTDIVHQVSFDREESKMLTESPLTKLKSKTGSNPLEKANDLLVKVETLSQNELHRIIKSNLNKEFDDSTKSSLQKLLKYLFGKKESDDYFAKFLREKRLHDLKLNKVPKLATKKKTDSIKVSGLNLRHSHNDLSKNNTQDSTRREYNNSMEYENSTLSNSPLKSSSILKSQPFFDLKATNPRKSQFGESIIEESQSKNVTAR